MEAEGPYTLGEVHGEDLRKLHSGDVYAEWRPTPEETEAREWDRKGNAAMACGLVLKAKRCWKISDALRRELDDAMRLWLPLNPPEASAEEGS